MYSFVHFSFVFGHWEGQITPKHYYAWLEEMQLA
jgi:hypothetical protein